MAARRDERGSGMLSSALGVAMVTGLLGLAANVAVGLWTRSTVEAVAHDAATTIAAADGATARAAMTEDALARARRLLGPAALRTRLDVESLEPDVVVSVEHPGVALLPRLIGRRAAFGAVDQRIVVRAEAERP